MADSIEISADGWLDEQRRDPASELSGLLRELAGAIADEMRIAVPKKTERTLRSIGVSDHFDRDGFFEAHADSDKLITNINESSDGLIRNRHSLDVKRRFAKPESVRKANPFQTIAVDSVAVIE